jgi:O-methyltransferase
MSNNDDLLTLILKTIESEEFIERRFYEPIIPAATYAPWRSNAEFQNVYEMIAGHTLVDRYRCWNLWHLVGQAAKRAGALDHFVEIGVWRGGTGVLIARALARCGLCQPIYLCDTFQGVTKTGINDPHYQGGEHADTSIEIVAALAASAGLRSGNYEIVAGVFPEDMPVKLRAGSFAFAHIDVDAYQSAKECFEAIWPRMIPGGVVVFDDYGFATTSGVAKVVDELMRVPDAICMYNLTGQAVFIKLQ